jgi:hypothetical protein
LCGVVGGRYLTAQTETSTAIAVVKQELRESISDVERASIIAAERHLTAVRTLQDEQRQVLSEIVTLRVEMKQTLIDNEAKSKPLTPTEQAQRHRDAGLNIPPYLQRDLALEKAKQDAIENDPARRLAEVNARIAELKALKDSQAEKPCPQ